LVQRILYRRPVEKRSILNRQKALGVLFAQYLYAAKAADGGIMPKDSQVDNKRARVKKAKDQTPLTNEEVKNKNKTVKKQSANQNDV
jgi:hypothetical protein